MTAKNNQADKVKCVTCAHFIMKPTGETEARRIQERHMLTLGYAKCKFVREPYLWKLAEFDRPCAKFETIDADQVAARRKLFDDRRATA